MSAVYSTRIILIAVSLILAPTMASIARAQQPAQPSPPSAERPRESAEAKEIPATIIEETAAVALLGRPVQSARNEDLGRIVDVIADHDGRLRAAVIDFGGFLGVGARKIAVDWRALHFAENGGVAKLIADLPRDQLRSAPIYKEGEAIVVIGAPASASQAGPAAKQP